MKYSSEAKIGFIGIATLLVLIWGINYLKGRNILRSTYALEARFDESHGLEGSAPVLWKGLKIGYVDRIDLEPQANLPVRVRLAIEKEYPLRTTDVASLVSTDLLGSKAIRIDATGDGPLLADGDSIASRVIPDLLSGLASDLDPLLGQVNRLGLTLDSLAGSLLDLTRSGHLTSALAKLDASASALQHTLSDQGSLAGSLENLESFSIALAAKKDDLTGLIGNLHSLSAELDSSGLGELPVHLNKAGEQLEKLLADLNQGTGSAGLLLKNDSLYWQLSLLVTDLDLLVTDLRENPGRYVRFSVFGK
ncbi:MAG: MlaD family protein [Bacteroidales bacterium]